jgi:hypothetical protein
LTDDARRRPAWVALSELSLDTELSEGDLDRIASVLRDSGYGIDELFRIYLHEVAPVVYLNLFSVAGAWSGFDEDWLCAAAERRWRMPRWRREWRGRLPLTRGLMTYATARHWPELERRLGASG